MKYKWQESEELAAAIYGKKTSASGSGVDKLDIIGQGRFEGLLIENKFTENKSFTLSSHSLRKAKAQAAAMGKNFLMRIDFGDGRVYILQEETDFVDTYPEK